MDVLPGHSRPLADVSRSILSSTPTVGDEEEASERRLYSICKSEILPASVLPSAIFTAFVTSLTLARVAGPSSPFLTRLPSVLAQVAPVLYKHRMGVGIAVAWLTVAARTRDGGTGALACALVPLTGKSQWGESLRARFQAAGATSVAVAAVERASRDPCGIPPSRAVPGEVDDKGALHRQILLRLGAVQHYYRDMVDESALQASPASTPHTVSRTSLSTQAGGWSRADDVSLDATDEVIDDAFTSGWSTGNEGDKSSTYAQSRDATNSNSHSGLSPARSSGKPPRPPYEPVAMSVTQSDRNPAAASSGATQNGRENVMDDGMMTTIESIFDTAPLPAAGSSRRSRSSETDEANPKAEVVPSYVARQQRRQRVWEDTEPNASLKASTGSRGSAHLK